MNELKIFASLVASLLLSGATCLAAELEAPVDSSEMLNLTNDGYVIIARTVTGDIVRASAKSLKIMEIDYVTDGATDGNTGNVVGEKYEPSKIALIDLATVNHEGETYHTFRTISGSIVRITVDDATDKVVEISTFSKELAN